ncbi:uncharacterized protein LOC119682304 [Teleopsis dalmanni]|uniref:uncharacterized protein LOC119682304 n=1 Tax=Teleopsis dalmanni TaxID=139649 RepID=UPI0018CD21AD|nr:uncharacterized protein LOC119682304 [Teleopsis dalmanni]
MCFRRVLLFIFCSSLLTNRILAYVPEDVTEATVVDCSGDNTPVCATNGTAYILFPNNCLLQVTNGGEEFFKKIPLKYCQQGCDLNCPEDYVPICGLNHQFNIKRTFTNECELKREACLTGADWSKFKNGVCPSKKAYYKPRKPLLHKSIPCLAIYNPVCALFAGVKSTFKNECEVNAEHVKSGKDWQIISPGICAEDNGRYNEKTYSHKRGTRKRNAMPKDKARSFDFNNPESEFGDDVAYIYAPSIFQTQYFGDDGQQYPIHNYYNMPTPNNTTSLVGSKFHEVDSYDLTAYKQGAAMFETLPEKSNPMPENRPIIQHSAPVHNQYVNERQTNKNFRPNIGQYMPYQHLNNLPSMDYFEQLEKAFNSVDFIHKNAITTTTTKHTPLRAPPQHPINPMSTINVGTCSRCSQEPVITTSTPIIESLTTVNTPRAPITYQPNQFENQLRSSKIIETDTEKNLDFTTQPNFYKFIIKSIVEPTTKSIESTKSDLMTGSDENESAVEQPILKMSSTFERHIPTPFTTQASTYVTRQIHDNPKRHQTTTPLNQKYSNPSNRTEIPYSTTKSSIAASKSSTTSTGRCPYGNTKICATFWGRKRTFDNLCELRLQNSKLKAQVWTFLHEGTCEDCKRNCTKSYNPICVTRNGINYTMINRCYLDIAMCQDKRSTWNVIADTECQSQKKIAIKDKYSSRPFGFKFTSSYKVATPSYSRLTTTSRPLTNKDRVLFKLVPRHQQNNPPKHIINLYRRPFHSAHRHDTAIPRSRVSVYGPRESVVMELVKTKAGSTERTYG